VTQQVEPVSRRPVVLDLDGSPTSVSTLLADAWRARELTGTLARRDFFSRYRRASLGIVWAVAMPLLQAFVLAIVFTKVARLSLPGNAFVFVFSGMASWAFFSSALGAGSTAIVDNSALASRIYFPRLTLSAVAVASTSYMLVVNYVVLLVAEFVTGASLSIRILYVPAGLVLAFLVTLTLSTVLAALHVYFRDVKYLIQAVLLIAFYLTPVFYPLGRAPAALRGVAEANPMTGVIELTRRGTVGADHDWLQCVAITGIWVVVLVALSLWLYGRHDRRFADLM
jgi:ABC-type polysaccharide/polyol phosphate export permease